MRRILMSIAILAVLTPAVWSKYDPIMQLPEIQDGWTPRQAAEWSAANMEYAEAEKHFGENSLQAYEAKDHLDQLARRLDAYSISPVVSEQMNPGTNGTLAPASQFETPFEPFQ